MHRHTISTNVPIVLFGTKTVLYKKKRFIGNIFYNPYYVMFARTTYAFLMHFESQYARRLLWIFYFFTRLFFFIFVLIVIYLLINRLMDSKDIFSFFTTSRECKQAKILTHFCKSNLVKKWKNNKTKLRETPKVVPTNA